LKGAGLAPFLIASRVTFKPLLINGAFIRSAERSGSGLEERAEVTQPTSQRRSVGGRGFKIGLAAPVGS
jgi:hypothetical protein